MVPLEVHILSTVQSRTETGRAWVFSCQKYIQEHDSDFELINSPEALIDRAFHYYSDRHGLHAYGRALCNFFDICRWNHDFSRIN